MGSSIVCSHIRQRSRSAGSIGVDPPQSTGAAKDESVTVGQPRQTAVIAWLCRNTRRFVLLSVMVAPYKTAGDSFLADSPRSWSPHSLADTGVLPNFDVAPDGERILALMPAARPEEQQSANHVTFMLNFSDEVRRRTMPR